MPYSCKNALTHTFAFILGFLMCTNLMIVDQPFEIENSDPFQVQTSYTEGTIQDEDVVSVDVIYNKTCNREEGGVLQTVSQEWQHLCEGIPPDADGTTHGNIVSDAVDILQTGNHISIVQIGAHTGFEPNDPISFGMTSLLNALEMHGKENHRKLFHWTFVEPSPANYRRLVKNLANYTDLFDMNSVNAAVISDSMPKDENKILFYSLSDDIDPETGYDSRSGKSLPHYITQVSSMSMGPLRHNAGLFKRKGLNMDDYVVAANVTAKRYTDLMEDIHSTNIATSADGPFFVLIDTEGFDCDIILGISPLSKYLPKYLLYENKICNPRKQTATEELLRSMGYYVTKIGVDNTMAIKK